MLHLNYLQLYIVLLLGACTTTTSKQSPSSENIDAVSGTYRWVNLTEEADFPKSYNFQMIALRDTLWVLHPRGNWFSLEGKNWTKSPLSNSINNLAFLDYILWGESLYGLGHFEGNIETYQLTAKVFRTDDMNSWKVMPGPVNLPERFFYHPFLLKDKLWIIGGNDGRRSYADAWSSTNGTQWTKEADNLPFGNRDGQQFVLFKNRIFMLANDVWSSEEGVNWKLETKEILPGEELFGYSPVVFDGKIWLLGCNRNGKFSSQVLVSDDGVNWTGENAPWSPRGGIASVVFNGKVYMTGGKYGGMDTSHPEFEYSNDVWMLEKVR